jgi:hypothetical protein
VTMSMATRQEKLCQTLNQPWLVVQQNQAGSSLNDAMGRPISLAPDRYICSNQKLEQSEVGAILNCSVRSQHNASRSARQVALQWICL